MCFFSLKYEKSLLTFLLAYFLTCLLSYLLKQWSSVLLEKVTGSQLVKKFSVIY